MHFFFADTKLQVDKIRKIGKIWWTITYLKIKYF